MPLDSLPVLDVNDTDVIEEGITVFAEKIGDLLQDLIAECQIDEVVGAVGIEVQFFEPLKIGDSDEEVGGFTSVWVAPHFLDQDSPLDDVMPEGVYEVDPSEVDFSAAVRRSGSLDESN